jgi:uncharacterized membrane protein
MTSLVLAALFWIALHAGLAGPARPTLARRLGENGFRGLFSALSLVGLVWLGWAYRAAPGVPLWGPIPGARVVALALMLAAFVLLVLGATGDNPTSPAIDALDKQHLPVKGVTRITRHPMLWAFALWAAAHLLVNGDAASLLLFGAILVTALNGMVSIDRKRRRALGPAWDDFERHTSRVPFAAILAGRNELRWSEIAPLRLAAGVALFAAALWLHPLVLGVSPLPG